MEHSELVQEMVLLEKLTAQERLKHAKRRRQQQLTNWIRREGVSGTPGSDVGIVKSARAKKFSVQFPENVVLLEGNDGCAHRRVKREPGFSALRRIDSRHRICSILPSTQTSVIRLRCVRWSYR